MVSPGDNNNNNKDNKDQSYQLSLACWEETIKGIANVLTHVRGTWYATDTTIRYSYQWEREQLEKYVLPFQLGAGAAMFLLFNFRIFGSPRFQAWRKQWMSPHNNGQHRHPEPPPSAPHSMYGNKKIHNPMGSSGGQSRSTTSGSGSRPMAPSLPPSPPVLPGGYLETKRERDIQAAMTSMRLITDVLVSCSVGISGTLFLLQSHKETLRRDLEQAPLVSGRSVVADEMCEPFLKLFHDYNHNNNTNKTTNQNDEDNDPTRKTFSKFAANCQIRHDLEHQIRQEKGLSDKEPVTIPLFAGLRAQRRGVR